MKYSFELKELDELERVLSSLLVRRDSQAENVLCHIVRKMSDDDKKTIIQMLAERNTAMAASVSVRINISREQQSDLFENVLARGRSNEIKLYVDRLFVHRLGFSRMIGALRKYEASCTKGVYFASYYLGASRNISEAKRREVKDLFQRVKLRIAGGESD